VLRHRIKLRPWLVRQPLCAMGSRDRLHPGLLGLLYAGDRRQLLQL
jgi:hypothetical protein